MSNTFFNNSSINNDIKTLLSDELEKFGHFRFAYTILKKNNPSCFTGLTNYPDEWAATYMGNAYQYIDPVMTTALNSIDPFLWDEQFLFDGKRKLKKGFEFAKKYNITDGFTLTVHDPNNHLVTLTILIDGEQKEQTKKYLLSIRDKLQILLIDTHAKLINRYGEEDLKIRSNKDKNKELSARENEVLYWASMGKTYPEISTALGVKTSTVKFHMGNVVKKLGVFNAKQAIRLGLELQLIKPI